MLRGRATATAAVAEAEAETAAAAKATSWPEEQLNCLAYCDSRLSTPDSDCRLQTPDSVEPSAVDFSELLIAPRALSVAFPLAPQIFKCCACDFSFRLATVAVAEAAASAPASALSPASAGKWSRWD